MKITRGRGSNSASTGLGPGRNVSASTPLTMRLIRPSATPSARHSRSISAEIAANAVLARIARRKQRSASGPAQLFRLAVVARAGRLDQGGRAREQRASQASRHRFPQRLVRVDDVDFGAEPPRAAITPVTKLNPKSGPRVDVLIQRWIKMPLCSSSSTGYPGTARVTT